MSPVLADSSFSCNSDIEQLLTHYDNLKIAQIARLLHLAEEDTSELNETRFGQLQEVSRCHLLLSLVVY